MRITSDIARYHAIISHKNNENGNPYTAKDNHQGPITR